MYSCTMMALRAPLRCPSHASQQQQHARRRVATYALPHQHIGSSNMLDQALLTKRSVLLTAGVASLIHLGSGGCR